MTTLPADNLSAELRRRLFAPLARLRRRCRLYLALNGGVPLALVTAGALLGQFLLDRSMGLTVDQRALVDVMIVFGLLATTYRLVLTRVGQRLDDWVLAATVDRAHPHLRDQLVTAVQFAEGRVGDADTNSPALVQATLLAAVHSGAEIRFQDALNHRQARRRGTELLGILLAAGLVLTLAPDATVATWWNRNWRLQDVPWPRATRIHPIGFDERRERRAPRGDELEIAATIEGVPPRKATLRWWTPSGRSGREAMTRIGSRRLEAALGKLTEEVHFRISGGDEQTAEYVVQAVERPRVVHVVARITPPEYVGLDAITLEQTTVIEVLQGSTLEIEAELNKPVVEARFVDGQGLDLPCAIRTGPASRPPADHAGSGAAREVSTVRLVWTEPASGGYHFELADADGWRDRRPVRWNVKVVSDEPPAVHMEIASVSELVTPQARIPVDARFEDAYGLGAVGLLVQKADGAPRQVELSGFSPHDRDFKAEAVVSAEQLGALPGDSLRIWAEAVDLDPAGPNRGSAPPVELRVVSLEDFLAEMAQREMELRREFERQIAAQRSLRESLEPAVEELASAGAAAPQLAQRLAGFGRRQDGLSGRCSSILRQFAQILVEMRASQALRPGDEERLRDRVMTPLGTLTRDIMPAAVERILAARSGPAGPDPGQLLADQDVILREMSLILANMLEWEGYREAVNLLRDVITQQSQIRQQTVDAIEQQLQEILELPISGEPAADDEPGK